MDSLVNTVHDRINVRNNSEHLALALLALEALHDVFESFVVQRAEALVHE